jgi:hypothetical protein
MRISHVADNYIADCVVAAHLEQGDCVHTIGPGPDYCTVCFARRELRRLGFWEVAYPRANVGPIRRSRPGEAPWKGTAVDGTQVAGDLPPRREPLRVSPRHV